MGTGSIEAGLEGVHDRNWSKRSEDPVANRTAVPENDEFRITTRKRALTPTEEASGFKGSAAREMNVCVC
jgi:hypothetical protein